MSSQNERILEVLADRKPHTVTEIHERAGTCRLNSRISELRKRVRTEGLDIVCRRDHDLPLGPDAYTYQLEVAA